MATQTFTSTTYANNPPKAVHAGLNSVSGQFNSGSVATTVGDIIFLCKLPPNAVVEEVNVDTTTGATATGISFGYGNGAPGSGSASYSALIASLAISTISRRAVRDNFYGQPCTLTVSDSLGFAIFAAKVESGTGTTSTIINWSITYRSDGN